MTRFTFVCPFFLFICVTFSKTSTKETTESTTKISTAETYLETHGTSEWKTAKLVRSTSHCLLAHKKRHKLKSIKFLLLRKNKDREEEKGRMQLNFFEQKGIVISQEKGKYKTLEVKIVRDGIISVHKVKMLLCSCEMNHSETESESENHSSKMSMSLKEESGAEIQSEIQKDDQHSSEIKDHRTIAKSSSSESTEISVEKRQDDTSSGIKLNNWASGSSLSGPEDRSSSEVSHPGTEEDEKEASREDNSEEPSDSDQTQNAKQSEQKVGVLQSAMDWFKGKQQFSEEYYDIEPGRVTHRTLTTEDRSKSTELVEKAEELLLKGSTGKWKTYYIFSDTVSGCYVSKGRNFKRSEEIIHPLFTDKGITIPKGNGLYVNHTVTFPHFYKESAIEVPMLQCPCNIVNQTHSHIQTSGLYTQSNDVPTNLLCDGNGKIHFSKGLWGDNSFFVYFSHSNNDGTFQVIAHLVLA